MNTRPLCLLIFLFQPSLNKADLCKKCECFFEEITPFIDCSSLNITKIPIKEIPSEKLKARTVDIDLEINSISEIQSIPSNIPIERLSLRKNNISIIQNGAFESLVYLSYVDLSYNNLKNLNREVFRGDFFQVSYEFDFSN